MTKAQLIAALAQYPDEALVYVPSNDGVLEVVRHVGWLSPLDRPDGTIPFIGIYLDPQEEKQDE